MLEETSATPPAPQRRGRGRVLLTAALVGSIALAIWSVTWPMRNRGLVKTTKASIESRSAAPAPPPAIAREQTGERINVRVDSRPAGARVVDAATGRLLGVTPFSARRDRASGALKVNLELQGYETAEVELPLDFSSVRSVELRAR
jgi:hypothetical protein